MLEDRRFLIVDPSHAARATLAGHLGSRLDCVMTAADSAAAARELFRAGGRFDAIFLEVRLPDGDGRDLCREWRAQNIHVPVLMLGTSARETDAVWALDAGASDYLVKPYRPAELLARLRAQLRSFDASEHAEVRIGNVLFRPGARVLVPAVGTRPVRLTDKEAGLLKHLHRAAGRPVAREVLLRDVWGYREDSETHTVETHIYRLRRKIEGPGCGFVISGSAGSYCLRTQSAARQRSAWMERVADPLALAQAG
jgi:DNA-binding response OmpR family regulator